MDFAGLSLLLIWKVALIFCRVGTAMMFMPGFGEIYVLPRVRLLMALAITLALVPVLGETMPPMPPDVLSMTAIIGIELLVGAFFGGIGRILQGTLHIAGMIIAFQSSLASALLFDANQGSQGSVFGNFITLVGLTLLFTTNLHHLIIAGLAESYRVLPAGDLPHLGDMSQAVMQTVSSSFLVAFKIASPLIVVGLLLYLGAGIMSRLMPNMQVFFVMIPAQIYISFLILMFTFSAGMLWYMEYFQDTLLRISGS